MDCCKDKNITKYRSEYICMNCSTIHGYEYVHFTHDDYDSYLNNNFKFEGKRKDTSLVITRSFQYFFEHRHQLYILIIY